MERRRVLALLGATALAGCAGVGAPGDDADDNGDSDGTGDGTGEGPTITGRRLTDTGECSAPETASVTFAGAQVELTGCITGANGCSTAVLGSATVAGDELTVVVDTDDSPPGDVGCTQALVPRGYRGRIAVDGGLPATVAVVHESARGREVVARVDRP